MIKDESWSYAYHLAPDVVEHQSAKSTTLPNQLHVLLYPKNKCQNLTLTSHSPFRKRAQVRVLVML